MALFGGKDGKDDRERPAPAADPAPSGAEAAPAAPRRAPPARDARTQSPPLEVEKMANVGKSITIKGDISGDEDLLVEGKVDGKVDLPEHQLTVGANGVCEASVSAKTVIVTGRIAGDVTGIERVEIQASGVVDGDVKAPRLIVEEGAVLNGSISMTKKDATGTTTAKPKPAEAPKAQASGGFATP
jgi:cytoskeletal protein CcmA (bactofilin family)